jgi:hypothetical protein
MIEAIQKSGAYSKEEVLRLVIDEEDREYEINKKVAETDRILNDMSIGRYETIVTTQVQTPTARLARYYEILEAVKAGLPIPPEILVEVSDWPEKDKIKEAIQQQKQMQAQQMQMELAEKQKDRAHDMMKVEMQSKGNMLRDAQKSTLDVMTREPEKKEKPKAKK